MLSKKIDNKNCVPRLEFFNEKKIRKIMIFVINKIQGNPILKLAMVKNIKYYVYKR